MLGRGGGAARSNDPEIEMSDKEEPEGKNAKELLAHRKTSEGL
jgi:hypothetical protein